MDHAEPAHERGLTFGKADGLCASDERERARGHDGEDWRMKREDGEDGEVANEYVGLQRNSREKVATCQAKA